MNRRASAKHTSHFTSTGLQENPCRCSASAAMLPWLDPARASNPATAVHETAWTSVCAVEPQSQRKDASTIRCE